MPETATTATYKPFIDLLTEGAELPSGFTAWGFKVVRRDLTTYNRPNGRFQWPHSGVVEDPNARGTELCPSNEDGGMAIAKNLRGARDGQYGYGTILLIAYNPDDVLATGNTKVRVRRCAVVKVLNPDDVYASAAGHDLSFAELSGAQLRGADLSGANLSNATFRGADLSEVNFDGANVDGADFSRANLLRATGRPKSVGTATLRNAVMTNTPASPFHPIKVPRGRNDILDALTGAGVHAVFEGTDSPRAPSRRSPSW